MEPIEVYRQEKIREKLVRDVSGDRLAPSIIFHGLPGLGKERMAFNLAQMILCGASGQRACGGCPACRKVEKLLHPDVQWVFPGPGSLDESDREEILSRKAKEDFSRLSFDKTSSHSIEAIRHLRAVSGKRPYEGRAKVFILTEGDRMTVEAANAFLKLLEEPPEDTVIVMTTARLHALLPTIRSRCEMVRFSPLPLRTVREALVDDVGMPPEQAEQLSRCSGGSIGEAVWISRGREQEGWEDAWSMVQVASGSSDAERYAYVMESPLRRDRKRLRLALDSLVPMLRDLAVVQLGGGPDEVIHLSRYALLKTGGPLRLEGMIRSVRLAEETRRLLDRNVNTSILLWDLTQRLSMNFRKE